MPAVYLRADSFGASWDDNEIWHHAGIVSLRQEFTELGYPRIAESTITYANVSIESLDTLWAFKPVVANLEGNIVSLYTGVVQTSGAIDCRISTDDGTTWRFWGGVSWDPLTASEWTTFADLNDNLGTLPFGLSRSIKLAVRLRRGTETNLAPKLDCVRIGYGLINSDGAEDVHRTVKRLFSDIVTIPFRNNFVADGTAALDLNHPVPIGSVVSVFDPVADPTRATDLYDGTFTGTVLDLNASPTIGTVLEVTWNGTPQVALANPDLDLTDESVTHYPQILLRIEESVEPAEVRHSRVFGVYTVNEQTGGFWNEMDPKKIDYRVNVFSLAADEVLAIKMSSAIYRAISDYADKKTIRMAMAGTEATPLSFTPPFSNITDTSEHLSVKQFSFILYVNEWSGEIRTGVVATDFSFLLTE